jgi:hypothetical protein
MDRSVRGILLAILIGVILFDGVALRKATWRATRHVRFQHDLVNGFYWGTETLKQARALGGANKAESWPAFFNGYLSLYDQVEQNAYETDYQLDYPPLRLLTMSIWTKYVRHEFPGVDDGHPDGVEPLLYINLVCELSTAIGIFLLVRFWVRRAAGATGSRYLHRVPAGNRAWLCGLAAASVAWFEPSMILDAHGWPQWDVWILPFFVFAALAASTRRWFWCGCLLAVGVMFKGQLLMVVPFFLLWPLWQKRWKRALRFAAGFLSITALVVSPWLLPTPSAWLGVAVVTAAVLLAGRGKFRAIAPWIAGAFALITFTVGALANGSFAWLRIGFLYGSEHYPYLFISSCYNLPSLLDSFGWSLKDSFWTYEFGTRYIAITLQWTLRLLYLGALALCAFGAARQDLRRNSRVLIAIAAPWLLMFGLLGQMHERYLMWGAVVSAVALGVNLRLTLAHFALSLISTAMIVHVMLIDKKLDPTLGVIDVLYAVRPYASALLLACVALFSWEMLARRVFVPQTRPRRFASPAPALAFQSATEA